MKNPPNITSGVRRLVTAAAALATLRSMTRSRIVALAVGLAAALTGVAHAATQPTAPATKNYHVVAHTGDRPEAGTDSDVYLKLYGKHAGTITTSPELQLDNLDDNFERDDYDHFNFQLAGMGTLTRACVRFDRLSGDHAPWYPEWIRVNGVSFQLYRWFDKDQIFCVNRA
jgi:hypothetical protein